MSASGFWPTDGTLEATLFLHRWKGENVSTAEVADVLAFLDCIKHVTVYGVHIPGDLPPPPLLTFSCVLLGLLFEGERLLMLTCRSGGQSRNGRHLCPR